jgi:hypothetical protein
MRSHVEFFWSWRGSRRIMAWSTSTTWTRRSPHPDYVECCMSWKRMNLSSTFSHLLSMLSVLATELINANCSVLIAQWFRVTLWLLFHNVNRVRAIRKCKGSP